MPAVKNFWINIKKSNIFSLQIASTQVSSLVFCGVNIFMSDILLMPSFRKRCIRATLSTNYLFSLVLVCASAHAQTAPDAGQLQRQTEQNLGAPAASKPPAAPAPIPNIDHSGPRITVRHFAISGASLITSEELAAQLTPYVCLLYTSPSPRD